MTDTTNTTCPHPLGQVDSAVDVDGELHVHCGGCDTSWVGRDVPFGLAIGLAQATATDFRGVFSAPQVTDYLGRTIRRDLGLERGE